MGVVVTFFFINESYIYATAVLLQRIELNYERLFSAEAAC